MNQNEITLTLTVDINTFNTIMAGLDELPHKLTRRVIDNLGQQAQSQIQQQQTPAGPLSDKVIN